MTSKFALAAAALSLAACQPQQQAAKTPEPAPPAAAPSTSTPAEQLDPFVVAIDATRWGVIIDKAIAGAQQAQAQQGAIPSSILDESDLYRADTALKRGAASLIELRDQVCGQGLVTGAACDLNHWPAWTSEAPTGKTSIEELDRRSQWLGAAMQPFTDAGCEAGRKTTKDELFCSVE